jgi:hypothetical protein
MTDPLWRTANPRAPHTPQHDRWMTTPGDRDYLAPEDRWCVLCGKDDSDHYPEPDGYRSSAGLTVPTSR